MLHTARYILPVFVSACVRGWARAIRNCKWTNACITYSTCTTKCLCVWGHILLLELNTVNPLFTHCHVQRVEIEHSSKWFSTCNIHEIGTQGWAFLFSHIELQLSSAMVNECKLPKFSGFFYVQHNGSVVKPKYSMRRYLTNSKKKQNLFDECTVLTQKQTNCQNRWVDWMLGL